MHRDGSLHCVQTGLGLLVLSSGFLSRRGGYGRVTEVDHTGHHPLETSSRMDR